VSGDLAVYTHKDFVNGSSIHYFDFLAGLEGVVPAGAPRDSDNLADVGGDGIVFSRTRSLTEGKTGVMLYVARGTLRELDPQPAATPMIRFGAVIGGDTVAYQEHGLANGEIFAYDLAAGTATNLSQSVDSDGNPAVAPAGDVVVWERAARRARAGQVADQSFIAGASDPPGNGRIRLAATIDDDERAPHGAGHNPTILLTSDAGAIIVAQG